MTMRGACADHDNAEKLQSILSIDREFKYQAKSREQRKNREASTVSYIVF